MSKNDGWAEVTSRAESPGFLVVINHFKGEPELWDSFQTEQEAREEAVLWNEGMWGTGFTYSAEWLKKQAEESQRK